MDVAQGYVDTLNFNIKQDGDTMTLRLFSISNIHGALGDHGQNYKTLSVLLKALAVLSSALLRFLPPRVGFEARRRLNLVHALQEEPEGVGTVCAHLSIDLEEVPVNSPRLLL